MHFSNKALLKRVLMEMLCHQTHMGGLCGITNLCGPSTESFPLFIAKPKLDAEKLLRHFDAQHHQYL